MGGLDWDGFVEATKHRYATMAKDGELYVGEMSFAATADPMTGHELPGPQIVTLFTVFSGGASKDDFAMACRCFAVACGAIGSCFASETWMVVRSEPLPKNAKVDEYPDRREVLVLFDRFRDTRMLHAALIGADRSIGPWNTRPASVFGGKFGDVLPLREPTLQERVRSAAVIQKLTGVFGHKNPEWWNSKSDRILLGSPKQGEPNDTN